MFPIRDHNPSSTTPVVTMALVAANVLVFILTSLGYSSDRAVYELYNTFALVPAEFTAGQDRWTLITSMFMHAGLWHIAGNMLFLWIFGDNLEDQMGHAGFLIFYLAAGMAGGIAQIAADPMSRVATVGASGAIAGVMGGYLLLFPKARVDIVVIFVVFFKTFTLPAWIMLGLWFGIQLVSGLVTNTADGGVAFWAHVGGFATGMLLTLPLWLRRGAAGFWRRTEGHPPHPPVPFQPTRIPRVPRR